MSVFEKIKVAMWGKLDLDEFKQFLMLGIILMFVLGSYWIMKPLKDGIFLKMVGKPYLAYAKILSVSIIIPLALVYAKLVDLVEKQKLFYIICSAYIMFFFTSALLLKHPTIGLANTIQSPTRIFGWSVYITVESFVTLVLTLFWSFVASMIQTDKAKRGYGLIFFFVQIGTITGSFLATQAPRLGIPFLTFVTAFSIFLVPVFIKIFITIYPSTAEKKTQKKKKKNKTGPIEGLRLLLTKPYLLGVLGVATLYEFAGTIIEFSMKFTANATYFTAEDLTRFFGLYGVTINTSTMLLTLLGTSFFIRKLGVPFCLVLYPTLAAVAIMHAWAFPTLWVIFGVMVSFKVLSYGLNNPCKEILYIPTSKDIKFKAKSWIDMFGARTAKVSGAFTTKLFPELGKLLFYGPFIALGIVGIWLTAAVYTGRENKKLIASKKILK